MSETKCDTKSTRSTGGHCGNLRAMWFKLFEPLSGVVRISVSVEHSVALVATYAVIGGAAVILLGKI